MKTDVLIVGAGPTGLALACQFIRHGVDFILIEKKSATTEYSKAIGVQARTLEIYDQFGVSAKLIEQGAIARKARMIAGGKVRGEARLETIGRGLSPHPYLLLVEQGQHEYILNEFIELQGHRVMWETELSSFADDGERVTAKVIRGGNIETVEAKFLAGCDGAKSDVRHALGLEFEGGTFARLFYVADVEIDWNFAHDAVNVCFAKNTVTAFFPMRGSEKTFRIVGTFPEGHEKDEREILYEEIEKQIVADTELNLDITKVNWFSVYKVHSRSVSRFSKGRAFLAGDAAHIHTPAGAQGMNTGIQDGYNLAWKMAMVLGGRAGMKLLETYHEERLPNARKLLQTTDRFFRLGASPEPLLSFFRTQIFPYIANFALGLQPVQDLIFPLISQIGINYRGSSLSGDTAGLKVKAGDRMPYFLYEGVSIYERIRQPKFHVMTFSDGREEVPDIGSELAEFADIADVHALVLFPEIAEKFGTAESFTLVLRPDNYIGTTSPGISAEPFREYMRAMGGGVIT